MSIRIERNAAGNCLTFFGQTNPVYFNACLSAEVIDTDYVNIINDIATGDGETKYEYYRIHFSEFQQADFNSFTSAQAVVDYIVEVGNVTSQNDVVIFGPEDNIDFELDNTSTSILFNNGDHHGVNSIKAVALPSGRISIESIKGDHQFYELDHTGCTIAGSAISGGLNDVINTLNEYFTVGAFNSVVISDPYSTMVADVDGVDAGYTLEGADAVDPIGSDIFTYDGSGYANYAGLKSTATIDQAGEYFTFDIRGEGTIGFGLVHTDASFAAGKADGIQNYADPDNFAAMNSAHYGMQFSHWFHQTPNGSWTNYGAQTGYVGGPGWSNWDQKQDWLDGNPVKIKCGLDENGYIAISSLQDDSTWVMHARSNYPAQQGASFHLGVKSQSTAARVATAPKVHLLEPEAPTMYFRYIESPDGYYSYPLFATQEESDYYELTESGADNGSHTHVYPDDPTNTTWYMPSTSHEMNYGMSPTEQVITFDGNVINWTEITSLSNADLAPPAFADTSITVDELSLVNYQLAPVDVGYVTTIAGTPNWSLVSGTTLMGTAPEVTGDNVANPSDTTTVTVYRTNSYGTSSGTLTINITNLTAPPVTPIAGVTHEGGTVLVDSDTMDAGSVISIDDVVEAGNRVVLDKEWLDNYVLPAITSGTGSKSVWIGFVAQDVTPDYSSISNADFRIAYEFNCDDSSRASNNWRLKTHGQGVSYANVVIGGLTNGMYDYVFINEGTHVRAGGLVASQGHNASTKVFDTNDAAWNWTLYNTSNGGSQDLIIATQNTQLDISLSEFNEYNEPTPPATMLTPWTKALDFSGSSERAEMVSTSTVYNPMMMAGTAQTVAQNGGLTSGHPWATACVFKSDGHGSNQHIWNVGEGAGSTDDNIALRVDAGGGLHFEWGRDGARNSHTIALNLGSASWYGVTVAHKGMRFSGSDATDANLSSVFAIDLWYYSSSNGGGWIKNPNTPPGTRIWASTGGRMDRSVTGALTIGGRGTNRSFHGKVASFVTTTLKNNDNLPSNDELKEMLTDPLGWIATYKEGNTFRRSYYTDETNWDTANLSTKASGTQVFLMGDGTNDSYSNMIRNQVAPTDQNYTKLNMISMVSNDIESVNITGLS